MQKTLNLILFLCAFSIQAQEINLTIGDQLYNYVSDVIPLETGDWLVVADVSDIVTGYEIRPRLLRVSAQNAIEWSVTLPPSYSDYSSIALRYDALLQQCYLVHQQFECDLIAPDVTYAFDIDGNLLWTDNLASEFVSYFNSATTIAMVPGEGVFSLGYQDLSAGTLLFRDAAAGITQEYPYDGPTFSGIYYWRPDTLLLTRGNRLLYATYNAGALHIFSEQVLSDNDLQTLHVLNDSVVYSQYNNSITRYDYVVSSGSFLADTTVNLPTNGFTYRLSFDNNELFAVVGQSIFTYSQDLRERSARELNIPGTRLLGAASNNQDLVIFGNTIIADNVEPQPQEGFIYSLAEEPLLNRDLELVSVSSTGIVETENPQGMPVFVFDSISVIVYNAGLDTVSSLHVKIQKRGQSSICPGFIGLNASFENLQLLPGDSISLYLGSLPGYLAFYGNTLCAWVGTEASPVETDFTNNISCTEVDIINALETPSSVSSLRVYPNPTNNLLYFNNTGQWQYYHLFDARGVLLQQAPLPAGEATMQLDVADLPVGLYHLVLDGREGRAQARVVKE